MRKNTANKHSLLIRRIILLLAVFFAVLTAVAADIDVLVVDGTTGEPLEFAVVTFSRAGHKGNTGGLTDGAGIYSAALTPGSYKLNVSTVGYKPHERTVAVGRSTLIMVSMSREDALREVVVTAQEARNASSASIIDTTAMRHLQPSSFSDIMELLPGGSSKDPEMGTVNTIKLRQASGISGNDDYSTASLGTSFIVDGVRLNTDADMQTTPDTEHSQRIATGKGVDMRSLSTDEIESVEIVRGIPSVEYGELTSGLVNIKRKNKAGRYEARFKADTQSQLFYVGKGFDVFGDNSWILNAGLDYLDSQVDPRDNRDSFSRVTGSLRSVRRWTGPALNFTWNSSFSYSGTFEKDDSDPDLTVNNTIDTYKNTRHNYRWDNTFNFRPVGPSVLKTLNVVAALSYADENLEQHKHVASSRVMPMPVSMTPGDNYVGYLPMLYLADYRVEGRPFTAAVKGSGNLLFESRRISEAVKFGVEWDMSKNYGRGAVYDIMRPLQAGNTSRPRAFSDIPAIHLLSAYVESQTKVFAGNNTVTLTAGLRETQMLNLDSRYYLSRRPYLDPRFNLVWDLPRASVGSEKMSFEIAGGAGWHTKMPVAASLYPDPLYTDLEQLNYYHNVEAYRTMNVRTFVEDMTNFGIKAARNFKWEVRGDISYMGNRLSVTYFRENMTDGFRRSGLVHIYNYRRYDATAYDPYATGRAPQIAELPYTAERYLAVRNRPSNGSRTRKEGIEYTLQTRRLPNVRTRLTVSGAYFKTLNSNSQPLWYKPAIIVQNKELQYVGLYDDTDGAEYTSFNTNFLFDTDIPLLGLNFSIGIQNMWFTTRRTLCRDGMPVQYMDSDGNVHPYTEADAQDPYLKQLVRHYTDGFFRKYTVPVSTTINLKATKTFWNKRVGLALYVNRLVAIQPDYKSYGITMRRYSTPYFGMELNLKI